MSDDQPFIAESNSGAYMLFFGALAFFFVTWALLMPAFGLHWTAMGSQFIAILGSALIYRAVLGDLAADWPDLNRLGAGPLGLFVLAVACVSLALTSNITTSLLVELVPAFEEIAEQYKTLLDELIIEATGWQKVLAIVSVSVAAPICEEALFRGTILQEQRKVERFSIAIIANGFLFSVFHLNPIGFVSLWMVGAFFAHMTLSSGTLWVPILAHAFFNLFNSTLLPAVAPDVDSLESELQASEMALALVVLAPLTMGLWALTVKLIEGHRARSKPGTKSRN